MNTTTATQELTDPSVPRFATAGAFLEALAAQDFDRLGAALSDDVHMRALLPPGYMEWDGASDVQATFTRWFGETERWELVDAVVGEVGSRVHLRWRVRLQAERLGEGWFTVEQQAYADAADDGRIARLSLLCTGYCRDRGDA
jgi:ketosteroid isomerase-like protein